jgi:hypothetical protein
MPEHDGPLLLDQEPVQQNKAQKVTATSSASTALKPVSSKVCFEV